MKRLLVFFLKFILKFNYLDQLNSELQTFGQQQTENGMGHTILPNGNNIFLADRYFPPFELVLFIYF